ncbi:MAG: PH domain-containing protein [Candidatus Micrarchaeia archaeon]
MYFVEIRPDIKKISFFYLIAFSIITAILTIFIIPFSSFFFGKVNQNLSLFLFSVLTLLVLIFFFNKLIEASTLTVSINEEFVEKKVGLFFKKIKKIPLQKIEAYLIKTGFTDALLGLETIQITSANPSEREDITIGNVDKEKVLEFVTILESLIKKK